MMTPNTISIDCKSPRYTYVNQVVSVCFRYLSFATCFLRVKHDFSITDSMLGKTLCESLRPANIYCDSRLAKFDFLTISSHIRIFERII